MLEHTVAAARSRTSPIPSGAAAHGVAALAHLFDPQRHGLIGEVRWGVSRVCPCCGYRALGPVPARGAPLCEVCAWEDVDPSGDRSWTQYRVDLAEAQRSFVRCGAADPELGAFARPPRPDEARPSWWTSLADAPAVLIELIERAFAGVQLDGGVSLDEAELIDDHALPPRTELDRPPKGFGHGPPWEDLTVEGLDRMPFGNFCFQDARGTRYYLPAFLRANLRDPRSPHALESLLLTLESGLQLPALHRLLTPPQGHAVARYLAFIALCDSFDASLADRVLRAQWGHHLDPEHLAHVSSASAP